MVGVAVKVTEVPEQMAPTGIAAMSTLAAKVEFTAIVIPVEVAGLPVKQALGVAVITTVITSLFTNVDEV